MQNVQYVILRRQREGALLVLQEADWPEKVLRQIQPQIHGDILQIHWVHSVSRPN